MRDAFEQFEAAGIELYAISYDDQKILKEFGEKQNIPYRLLSDIDSEVIRRYGILNDQVGAGDAFLEGIPYPGVYVTDEDGVVVAKFFHDTYKKRDSPEMLIDAALGRLVRSNDTPSVEARDPEVQITVFAHGGQGTIRQGIRRQLVVRMALSDGLHLYSASVPEGMIPTTLTVSAPPGLVVEDAILPPTEALRLESMDLTLDVWSGTIDFILPFYPVGELASETRPLDMDSVDVEVSVRYQACSDSACYPPKTERLVLTLALDVIDVPALGTHLGHGQREAQFSGAPHMARLMLRKLRRHPLGMLRLIWKTIRLEMAARRRKLDRS